ncbi:hypothetical protein V8C37DRAFT_386080 [Trichoderma ceciliae]
MFDAKLSRWGFAIFRTSYGEGTEHKWLCFKMAYGHTKKAQLCKCWGRATSLFYNHHPFLVSDPLLEGADIDVLRQRFKAMREQNEIPDRIAMDCFLIVDQTVLDQSSTTVYQPKLPGEPDPWQSTFSLRAINPDYDASAPIPVEGDSSGYKGEITIPFPKVFDWLYYCFLAKSEDWETRYKVVKGGAAEMMSPSSPYPAYRSGTEPENLLGTELPLP